ncbi:family 20 glycosylhydrolase [uncultured Dokdonia sp.]|uniref:family 20 glycosylhydrolase n=1 Tax=uncultured Dokdonia sp. TaxID=575653 RepID=UPI00262979F1|nr:family 20 glycosylhydrolase [uncultured Dokdonia sp.]
MRTYIYIIAALLYVCVSCTPEKPEVFLSAEERSLIPYPNEIATSDQGFLIDENTTVYAGTRLESQAIAQRFLQRFEKASGWILPSKNESKLAKNSIHFVLDPNAIEISNDEGYLLKASKDRIIIRAKTMAGLHMGIQTLYQLLPDAIAAATVTPAVVWAVPGVEIQDAPTYEYRGAMLDVARHFFSVQDVKRYIDLIASYKINKLHLHLTDDQGWRIEIKSWPKLTEIGGTSAVGGDQGGFYTQAQYRDIVAYAKLHHITIIPEIDMPGHTNAALASYPELNCDGKARALYTGMKVGFSTLCVDSEVTYTFLDDVIRELAALTDGDYIHLGGDESHVTPKKEYNLFLTKAQAIVKKYGKNVMGWEDIQSAGISDEAIVQHWTNSEIATLGAKQGASVVLSPAPKTYLDMKYTKETKIGLTWAGVTPIDSAYIWNPRTLLKDVPSSQIIGIESPLWTETVRDMNAIEYLAFPRLIGHAELGWSKEDNIGWDSYIERLKKHVNRLKIKEVDYYPSPLLEE